MIASALPVLLAVISLALSIAASVHILLSQRDHRSSIGWIGLAWLSPVIGSVLYVMLGINRIQRKARTKRKGEGARFARQIVLARSEEVEAALPAESSYLAGLAHLAQRAIGQPLTTGNAIEPLDGGDACYHAMLEAIEGAGRTIGLASYIFADDRVGVRFVAALIRARDRGVSVRVLLDDVGRRQGRPSVRRSLHKAGIDVVDFIPTLTPTWIRYFNLRNHRKILVVDGTIGFTGGANVIDRYSAQARGADAWNDAHFRLRGPVVQSLQQAFVADWEFAAGERLGGPGWFPPLEPVGPVPARGIPDGPDAPDGLHQQILLGALACARRSVDVVTPYFLPDDAIAAALATAAMRGLRVRLILPEVNNHVLVEWASRGPIEQVLRSGCQVWRVAPPFDHAKLMIVDGLWSLFGSANWDARSLRLNFEFGVEAYDRPLAEAIGALIAARLGKARRVRLEEIQGRSALAKLRDGAARLLSPYL